MQEDSTTVGDERPQVPRKERVAEEVLGFADEGSRLVGLSSLALYALYIQILLHASFGPLRKERLEEDLRRLDSAAVLISEVTASFWCIFAKRWEIRSSAFAFSCLISVLQFGQLGNLPHHNARVGVLLHHRPSKFEAAFVYECAGAPPVIQIKGLTNNGSNKEAFILRYEVLYAVVIWIILCFGPSPVPCTEHINNDFDPTLLIKVCLVRTLKTDDASPDLSPGAAIFDTKSRQGGRNPLPPLGTLSLVFPSSIQHTCSSGVCLTLLLRPSQCFQLCLLNEFSILPERFSL